MKSKSQYKKIIQTIIMVHNYNFKSYQYYFLKK